jgi:hypothetical protein
MPVMMILVGLAAMCSGALLMAGGWWGTQAVESRVLHAVAFPAMVAMTALWLLRFTARFAIPAPRRG